MFWLVCRNMTKYYKNWANRRRTSWRQLLQSDSFEQVERSKSRGYTPSSSINMAKRQGRNYTRKTLIMYTARSLVGWIHDVGMLHVTMHYVSMYYVKEKANTSFQQDKNTIFGSFWALLYWQLVTKLSLSF